MLDVASLGRDALLIAPTGGGKTLAGFLPSLVELASSPSQGLHTLYISPLKALTTDVGRNLAGPIEEMGLDISYGVRTGDTPANRRARLIREPPNILLTTPESLALLLSYETASAYFRNLRCVIIDELHALADNKRGALLSLSMTRLRGLAVGARAVGLSATVADEPTMLRYLSAAKDAVLIRGEGGAKSMVDIVLPDTYVPWSGHVAMYAAEEVYKQIERVHTTIVFVNTRAQAELFFGALWRCNKLGLPIALHHGSLAVEQRRRVEAAMTTGQLRAVVATSSLDLGLDWGDVDLVIQIGAPKGVSRLTQRIGRANHRLDEPSRAILIPANRFEFLECVAAHRSLVEGKLDGGAMIHGGLDVLAQHIIGTACSGPFSADSLYEEVRKAAPYRNLTQVEFDNVLDFVATGGYALQTYERYRRLERDENGEYRLRDRRMIRSYRMNIGTIVELPVMTVRLGRGRKLGEVEEYFVSMLTPGDTFLFAGRLLRFERIQQNDVIVSLAKDRKDPKVPAYAGGRLPLTTQLSAEVRAILADPGRWHPLPASVRQWLEMQAKRSELTRSDELLVESFPRGGKHYLVAYCFAGRNAHQTLGMLLTRRLEKAGLRPLGFAASDYCIAVWGMEPIMEVDALFDVDILGDDLEEWMAESTMIKRIFRNCAVVAGLIERRHPGQEKTGRQVSFNADLIYDVLRKFEPDHVLLQAARTEAAAGLTDIKRLADLLNSVEGRIRHRVLDRVSPFAVAIMADIGREFVDGESVDATLDEVTAGLVEEAMAEVDRLEA